METTPFHVPKIDKSSEKLYNIFMTGEPIKTPRSKPLALREQQAAGIKSALETNSDPETIQRVWETQKELVILAAEQKQRTAALELIAKREANPGQRFEEVPGVLDAEELVAAYQDAHPGKSTLEILPLIQQRTDDSLRTEIAAAKKEGLPVPDATQAPLIQAYLEVEADTAKILKGLEDLAKDPQPRTKERARAEHFIARLRTENGLPTENLVFVRAKANELLRLKKFELKKAGVLIP